jgi:hypothetical protein
MREDIGKQPLFPILHAPGLRGAGLVVESEHVEKPVDDEGEETLVQGYPGSLRLLFRPFHRDYQIAQDFARETIGIGEGDDVGGAVPPEKLLVVPPDFLVVREEDAEVSILQP